MKTRERAVRMPKVGDVVMQHGTLVAIEDVTPKPPPPQTDYIFETMNARVEVRRRGKALDTLNTWTEASYAIEAAKRYAEREEITSESEVEVVVVQETSYYRARPRHSDYPIDKTFGDFAYKESGSKWNVPPSREEIVWSTRTPSDTQGKG